MASTSDSQQLVPVDDKIERERRYLVYKSNELIQSSRFELSVIEQKIVLRIIQMIKPSDTEFGILNFSISEFQKMCGLANTSYTDLKNIIKNLADRSLYVTLPGTETETLIRWIEKPYFEKKSGIVQIKLDPDMKPFLLQLKSKFTSFSLYYTLPMKSKYSIRFYELLKSYSNMHTPIRKSLDELKNHLMCTKYAKWNDFNRFVLEPAVTEINKYTDINVSYKPEKEGRAVTHVLFVITEVAKAEQARRYQDASFETDANVSQRLDRAAEESAEQIASGNTEFSPVSSNHEIAFIDSTIPYSCGAHKKDMLMALRQRMHYEEIVASLTEDQKAALDDIIDMVKSLCCRHRASDDVQDGGNKDNINRVNQIILTYRSLDRWLTAMARKYDYSVFWQNQKNLKPGKNQTAYMMAGVEQDLANFKQLIQYMDALEKQSIDSARKQGGTSNGPRRPIRIKRNNG